MTNQDILFAGPAGHRCHFNCSIWMPELFQTPARETYAAIHKALGRMTRAKIVAYLDSEHGRTCGISVRDRKSDLVYAAFNAQYDRMYPLREMDGY